MQAIYILCVEVVYGLFRETSKSCEWIMNIYNMLWNSRESLLKKGCSVLAQYHICVIDDEKKCYMC